MHRSPLPGGPPGRARTVLVAVAAAVATAVAAPTTVSAATPAHPAGPSAPAPGGTGTAATAADTSAVPGSSAGAARSPLPAPALTALGEDAGPRRPRRRGARASCRGRSWSPWTPRRR
ncbi:hypothetical protein VSR01_35190 [Actinacidiphila sp. DG2A-62]|uniref:hypothetical protein n=1 Tax=Actinacidiphila sp. DG2A-62 TaxID=3108821 RepID=UPI002DBCAB41|nr:hypothetical protein [Actinacidiphila sp. DG2A-62]MEC3998454.1 hypothetical protein [Actinacidiphila sp. DG2A-62]